jgi:hypothetical protein
MILLLSQRKNKIYFAAVFETVSVTCEIKKERKKTRNKLTHIQIISYQIQ